MRIVKGVVYIYSASGRSNSTDLTDLSMLECSPTVPGLRSRLYPNQAQEQQFLRLYGASRFVYNELLSEQVEK